MTDFAKPYAGAVFFGNFIAENADGFGARDAIKVLETALDNCRDFDVRVQAVYDALDYLERRATRKWAFQQFRRALNSSDPEGRWQNINASLNAIKQVISA